MASRHRVRNWSNYNEALVNRGSLTLLVEPAVLDKWKNTEKSGKRGASNDYSDLAIETLLTLKSVYRLALRQTIGLACSLFDLMGEELGLPHYSILSRRAAKLSVHCREAALAAPVMSLSVALASRCTEGANGSNVSTAKASVEFG